MVVDIGQKGSAIGRSESGEAIIISKGGVPGDICDVLVLRKKKGLKYGVPVKFHKLSESRIKPFCRHFEDCGGCSWQNLMYEKQLELKENLVRQTIMRLSKEDPELVSEIIGCAHTRNFRNKLEYTFSNSRWRSKEEIDSGESFDAENALGFHVSGFFNKVIDIKECHLQDTLGNKIRNEIRDYSETRELPYYDITNNLGLLRNVIIRNSSLNQWMVTLVFGQHDAGTIADLLNHLIEEFPEVNSWNYIINTKKNSSISDLPVTNFFGSAFILERILGYSFRISPKSFFQTNPSQTEKLFNAAIELADISLTDIVYDLYSGTGIISVLVSGLCTKVIGVEEVVDAVGDAIQNAKDNHIENIFFESGDVKDLLGSSLIPKYGAPDLLFVDPPRAGIHPEVINHILEFKPKKIVYISCNPSTQARDIALLKQNYRLEKVIPVDMFPHTSHVESIAKLILKK